MKYSNLINEETIQNPKQFAYIFKKYYRNAINELKEFKGNKSNFYFDNSSGQIEWIKFSSILSDLTCVHTLSGKNKKGTNNFSFLMPDFLGRDLKINVDIPDDMKESYLEDFDKSIFGPTFYTMTEIENKEIHTLLKPLIEIGKVSIHPMRGIMKVTGNNDIYGSPNNKGIKNIKLLPVDINSSPDTWEVLGRKKQLNDISIQNSHTLSTNQTELFEISLPYIEGVSVKEFAKILSDEELLLSEFRSNLRKIVAEYKNGNRNIIEMKNDILIPAIDKIERKFQSISSIHKLRVKGATLTSIGIALTSLAMPNTVPGFLQLFGLVLSPAGFLMNETQYQQKIEELRDNPFYLLWKFNKNRT